MERALWTLGYPNDFDTVAEARAAVEHALSVWPELRGLSVRFEEA
jgi:hypothetical protein